ncbi:MAG: hypothetical protein SOR90_07580, partial [Oscillospiraceae bacterium]|nr:hypothetical protein [Oscillospiraceae bacterium]
AQERRLAAVPLTLSGSMAHFAVPGKPVRHPVWPANASGGCGALFSLPCRASGIRPTARFCRAKPLDAAGAAKDGMPPVKTA